MGVWAAILKGLIVYFLYAAAVVFVFMAFCIFVRKKSPTKIVAAVCVSVVLIVAPVANLFFQVQSSSNIEKKRITNQEQNDFRERCNSEQATIIHAHPSSFSPDVMIINEDVNFHTKNYATDFQLAMFFRGSPFQNVYEKRFIKDWLPEGCNDESASTEACTDRKFGYDYYHLINKKREQSASLSPPVSDIVLIRMTPAVPSSNHQYKVADILIEQNGRVVAKAKIYRSGLKNYCPSPAVVIQRMFEDISSERAFIYK